MFGSGGSSARDAAFTDTGIDCTAGPLKAREDRSLTRDAEER